MDEEFRQFVAARALTLCRTALARRRGTVAAAGPQSGRYLVPELGVQVTARGPLARRVLATISRSPLWVALAVGPAFPAPGSWRWYSFGGVRFAVPASWPELNSSRAAWAG